MRRFNQELLKKHNGIQPSAEALAELDVLIKTLEALAKVYPAHDPSKNTSSPWWLWSNLGRHRTQCCGAQAHGTGDLYAVDERKRLWVIDNKLMSRIDQRLMDSFVLNTQAQTYLLGARYDDHLRSLYRTMGGFIPNVIRKPALRQKETRAMTSSYRVCVKP